MRRLRPRGQRLLGRTIEQSRVLDDVRSISGPMRTMVNLQTRGYLRIGG
jgi:hypothetical protein